MALFLLMVQASQCSPVLLGSYFHQSFLNILIGIKWYTVNINQNASEGNVIIRKFSQEFE